MAPRINPVKPYKYDDKTIEKLEDHFNQPFTYEVLEEKMAPSGVVSEIRVVKPTKMPTFEGFARSIKVNVDTLHAWKKKHPEFKEAYVRCQGIQKEFLLAHGLTGGYSSSFAKFVAINCTDLVDKSEVRTDNTHQIEGYGLAFDLSKKPS